MKINFHVWTFTEQVHKQRKKSSSDFSLSWKKNKSPSCPQVKQFFSETSVLMCSRVILHHHAWSLVNDDLFWSLKAVLLRKQKGFTFWWHWNFSCLSHLQRNLSTRSKKKTLRRQLIAAFEKQTLKWQWKEDKSFAAKPTHISEDFPDPSAKMKKFPRLFIFSPLGWSSKWNWSKQFP